MAIRKKGSRRIVVDGVPYLWRVRHKVTYSQECLQYGLSFAVHHADEAGATLVVYLPPPHPSQSWLSQEAAVPLVPSAVARYIREALDAGWAPGEPGHTFVLPARAGG